MIWDFKITSTAFAFCSFPFLKKIIDNDRNSLIETYQLIPLSEKLAKSGHSRHRKKNLMFYAQTRQALDKIIKLDKWQNKYNRQHGLFLNICQFLCIMNKIDLFFYFFLKGCG
jgi:hypothetical protein